MKSKIIIGIICIIFSVWLYHYILLPRVIDSRAHDLNLLKYNSKEDKFIAKDTAEYNGWMLHYLKHGTMKNYKTQ